MDDSPHDQPQPLAGTRILDFTVFQQGPVGTTLLADLGAEVVKVEPPRGELGRRLRIDESGFSPFFEAHNRGKRSLTVDLKSERGREAVERLLPAFDVVAHNFRPGVMEKLGLGYEDVTRFRADIVYVAASGYGPKGPMASDPAFDGTGQALSGLMLAQRRPDDGRPNPVLYGLADSIGGLMLSQAVVTGLLARDRTGCGQKIDVSILGSLLFMQAVEVVESLHRGYQNPMRYRMSPTFGPYRGSDDQWFVIATVEPSHWPRICSAIERPDLEDHPQFSRSRWRVANADTVEAMFEAEFAKRTRDEWVARLNEVDIPCTPVLSYEEVAENAQVRANGYVRTIEHPIAGELDVVGTPMAIGERQQPLRNAPLLGADTDVLLAEAGYSPDEIAALRSDGVI